MSVIVPGHFPRRAKAGDWTTFSDPAAGQPWEIAVPAGKTYRIHGGSCQVVCNATVGTRVPFIKIMDPTRTYFAYVQYNRQNNTDFGPGANQLAQVVYNDPDALLPAVLTSLPYPLAIPFKWWPAGTIIQGGFDNMQAGDQISQVGMLLEQITL